MEKDFNKVLEIENRRIVRRNFAGTEEEYNRAGTRYFLVVIDDTDLALKLMGDGWNVKQFKPRNDGTEPSYYIKVFLNYEYERFAPKVYRIEGKKKDLLDASTINLLDADDIEKADIVIRPRYWEVRGQSGIKAYLKTGYFTVERDIFRSKYDFDEDEVSEDVPF